MGSTFTKLLYHFVFSTKDREPTIHQENRDRLYGFIGGIIRQEGGVLLQAGGVADHIHLLASLRAEPSVADMLRAIKSKSSGWMNRYVTPQERFQWQAGYAGFSVSESQVARVRRYIQNQESHHRRVSFKEELIELLERHGIEYDERYLL
jgi:putative transposase